MRDRIRTAVLTGFRTVQTMRQTDGRQAWLVWAGRLLELTPGGLPDAAESMRVSRFADSVYEHGTAWAWVQHLKGRDEEARKWVNHALRGLDTLNRGLNRAAPQGQATD